MMRIFVGDPGAEQDRCTQRLISIIDEAAVRVYAQEMRARERRSDGARRGAVAPRKRRAGKLAMASDARGLHLLGAG